MNSVKRIVILIVIIIAFSVVLAVTSMIHFRLRMRANYLEEKCTATVTGEVYTYPKGGAMLFRNNTVGAEFKLDDRSYHAKGIDSGSHNPGDTLIVHYNPDRPVESYAGIGPDLYNLNGCLLIYGVCILTIVSSIVSLISCVRKR